MTISDGRPRTDGKGLSFKVTDRPVAGPDMYAVDAIREAATAIERTFVGGADWRSVVGSLHLMLRILEEPARTCRRCGQTWRIEHGAAVSRDLPQVLCRLSRAAPCRADAIGTRRAEAVMANRKGHSRRMRPLLITSPIAACRPPRGGRPAPRERSSRTAAAERARMGVSRFGRRFEARAAPGRRSGPCGTGRTAAGRGEADRRTRRPYGRGNGLDGRSADARLRRRNGRRLREHRTAHARGKPEQHGFLATLLRRRGGSTDD